MKQTFNLLFIIISINLFSQIQRINEHKYYLPNEITDGQGNYKVLGIFGNKIISHKFFQHLRFQNNSTGVNLISDYLLVYDLNTESFMLSNIGFDGNHQTIEFGIDSDFDNFKSTKFNLYENSKVSVQTTFREFVLQESLMNSPKRISEVTLNNGSLIEFDTSSFLPTGLLYYDNDINLKLEKSRFIDSLFYLKLKTIDTLHVLPCIISNSAPSSYNINDIPIWKHQNKLYFILQKGINNIYSDLSIFSFDLTSKEIVLEHTISNTNYYYSVVGMHKSGNDVVLEIRAKFGFDENLYFYKVNYDPLSLNITQITDQWLFRNLIKLNQYDDDCHSYSYYYADKSASTDYILANKIGLAQLDTMHKNSLNISHYVPFDDGCYNLQFFCTVEKPTSFSPLALHLHVYNKETKTTFTTTDPDISGTYYASNFGPYYSFMETINDSLFGFVVYNNKTPPPGANYTKYGFRIFKYYIDEQALATNEVKELDKFSIFPNPGHHSFTLHNERFKGTAYVSVSNQLGQLVYQTQQNQPDMTIETSHWPAGIYFVTVTNSNSVQTLKWIKQ